MGRPIATSLLARVGLVCMSVLASLLLLEAACRLVRGGRDALLHWPNIARERMSIDSGGACAYRHDDLLGWSLPPNCASPAYRIDADGFRSTSAAGLAASAPPVLVTGSSFAMGDEVDDDQTWPAYLQDLLGRRVLNAGVSGYSLDQTVLNAERLAARVHPALIVVSFTPGDVWRTELKVAYSRNKPWFEPVPGGLELRGVPVPPPERRAALPVAARLLGWSMLADEVVERLAIREGWYYREGRAVPAGDGPVIACRLMSRLARLGVPVVVLGQYGLGHWRGDAAYQAWGAQAVRNVLRCATDAGLPTLDLAEPLRALIEARGRDTLYRTEHHTPLGNRLVAEIVQAELKRRDFQLATQDR
jgi:hypothetical protein